MFENVPEWLTEKIRGLRDTLGPAERGKVYYEASGWTIAWYLRMDIRAADADIFFDPPGDEPSDELDSLWYAHINRAVLVAETLFLLRSSPGFSELRKRLEKRDLQPSFFEMLAAKQFLKAGFRIDARQPVGVRGRDFDFLASRGDQVVNVEVTALEAAEFCEKTILNALGHKRKQLPNDAASVIYCAIPEQWRGAGIDWERALEGIAGRFLRNTRRVNVVVFWMEEHTSFRHDMPGGALLLIRKPYLNLNPRHPSDLGFLFSGERTETARYVLATGEGWEALERASYDSEFFRWIDTLVFPED